MSKPSAFTPTPYGSRPSSPPLGTPIDRNNEDKQALMMGHMGGNGASSSGAGALPKHDQNEVALKDQAPPILAYCAASITMTVVNKVSGVHEEGGSFDDSR